jgi:hypothetical protein
MAVLSAQASRLNCAAFMPHIGSSSNAGATQDASMNFALPSLPSPDVIELLELPVEMTGLWPPPMAAHTARQAQACVALACQRREQLEVIHLDNPRTTTFALFL